MPLNDPRVLVDIHGKLIAASSQHTIAALNSDAWLRDVRALYLTSFSFTGAVGTLPVVFLTLQLGNTDTYVSHTNAAVATQTLKETMVPLYPQSNGLRAELAQVALADSTSFSLANARIKLQRYDSVTGGLVEFTDYTTFVAEFLIDVGAVRSKKIQTQ